MAYTGVLNDPMLIMAMQKAKEKANAEAIINSMLQGTKPISNVSNINMPTDVSLNTAKAVIPTELAEGYTYAGSNPTSSLVLKNFLNKFGEGKTIGPKLANGFGDIKTAASNLRNTDLMGLGKIGNIATAGMGLYQGGKAISNLQKFGASDNDLSNLMSDIKSSAYANPLTNSYLNADQKRLLRQVQNGSFSSESNSNAIGQGFGTALQNTPKALLAALAGGAVGGIPGAAINGIGTLVNSGIEGANKSKQDKASKLQALYSTLSDAESDYNNMRRPSNLSAAGLQRRYSHSLY